MKNPHVPALGRVALGCMLASFGFAYLTAMQDSGFLQFWLGSMSLFTGFGGFLAGTVAVGIIVSES